MMNSPVYCATAFRQSLLLADALMGDVRARTKTVTVRTGRRAIEFGPLKLESTNGTAGACVVTVLKVSVTSLANVSNWALAGEGLTSPSELLDVLQRYYPTITMDSEVTAIEFAYVGEVAAADTAGSKKTAA